MLVLFGEEGFEAAFVNGFHVGFVGADAALLEFFPDGVVHELHSLVAALGDDVVEFVGGSFADDGGDGGVGEHDFVHGDAA